MESLQDVFNKPKPFTPNKNSIGKDWRVWKEQFLTYLKLIDTCSKLPGKGKALLLFNLMGQEAIIAKEKMAFQDPSEEENIDILFKNFDEIFNPPLNEMEERYKFFSRRKHSKESIDNYITDIIEQAAKCNFGDQINKFIIDMIILSMDKRIQKCTFLLKDISLSYTIKVYKESFINDKCMQDMCFEKFMNLNSENFNNAKTTNPLKFNTIDKEEIQQSELPESSQKNYKSNNIKKTSNVDNIFKDFTIISKDDLYTNNLGSNQNKAETSSGSKTENCRWCESKHIQGQCQHNLNCVRCDRFPHKICFQCKKNPHDDNCYYKTIITLPVSELPKSSQKNYKSNNIKETSNVDNIFKDFTIKSEDDLYTNYFGSYQNRADTSTGSKTENCLWCESKHIQGQCQHNLNCVHCDRFPHKICFQCKKNPHDDNCYYKTIITLPVSELPKSSPKNNLGYNQNKAETSSGSKTENCRWCESKHIQGQCQHNLNCVRCDRFPHKICFQCKKNPHDDNCYYKTIITLPVSELPKSSPKNNLGYNQNKAETSSGSKTENCRWCESKHIQGQCQHNLNCVCCDRFSHNICFQCKKNPRDDNCYYKTIITFPVNNSSNIVPSCSKSDTNHPYTPCPSKNEVCFNCLEAGNFTCTCKNSKTAEQMNFTQNQQCANDPNKNSSSKIVPVCSKCATYHTYKQCPVSSGNNEAKSKRVCSRCGTKHAKPYKQCPASSGNNEPESKRVCSRCGTKHAKPYKQCPASSGNNEPESKRVCSRCETNHPYDQLQCPASSGNNEPKSKRVCSRCETNHPYDQCPASSGNNETKSNCVCSRCGTNHPCNQCPASNGNYVCSKCATYHPYKQCPVSSGNNEAKSKRVCSRCGTKHAKPYKQCPAFNGNNEANAKRVCSRCGTKHVKPYKQCPAFSGNNETK